MNSIELSKKIVGTINYNKLNSYKLSDLVRPNEDKRIWEELQLKFNNIVTNDINRYLLFANSDEVDFFTIFRKTIPPTDTMNPHVKPYPPSKYFISKVNNKKLDHLDNLDKLLVKHGSNKINLLKNLKYIDGILQIGEKGSGKTLSQNIWLHKNHLKLEKNNIFWIRLDFAKLIDIWKPAINNPSLKLISSEEYFMGQIVYVISKHFVKEFPLYSEFIGELINKLSNSSDNKIDFGNESFYKSDLLFKNEIEIAEQLCKKKNLETITDVLKYFEINIAKYEGFYKGQTRKDVNSRYFGSKNRRLGKKSFYIDKVLKDSQVKNHLVGQGSKALWIIIGQRLREFILDNDCYILYVVDGMDNINFYHTRINQILNNVYDQLLEFPLKEERVYDNEIVLLSLRDTTYEDLLGRLWREEYIDHHKFRVLKDFKHIYQDSNGLLKEAFNKRIYHILSITKSNKSFIKKILETMLSYNNIIDERRWNSNIRTFMHNHLTLAKLIAFRYYFAGAPNDFNIKSQIDAFENINFLLNGHLYLNEKITKPHSNEGFNLFNIFGYVSDSREPIYSIYTRLLQIIKRKSNIIKKHLYELTGIFNYYVPDVDSCLDRLNRSGMIKIKYTPQSKTGVLSYSITQKGEYALVTFYSDIHFLYHSSIDTLLPQDIISNFKVAPNNFSGSLKKRYYAPFCIISGLVFLQYLISCNNTELKKVEIKKSGIATDQFKLPVNEELLLKSIKTMVEVSMKKENYDYYEVLVDYFKEENNVW
jgi:hypothetical protein